MAQFQLPEDWRDRLARIALSLSLLAVACLLFIISVCGQPADLQNEQDPMPNIRATVVAEITVTAAAVHMPPPTSTAASQLQILHGSFVTPAPISPISPPVPTKTPRPASIPLPIETPTLSSMVEDISPSVVQIVTPSGTGSGFVVDSDGLVLTNSHVVDGFSTVNVRFSNGRSHTGKVLGVDEVADLALIEISGILRLFHRIYPVSLGDSDEVKVGEEVVAMGFPAVDTLGATPTITRGIISAKRPLGEVTLLQTDAAINPGNSGGPLFRRDGQVIGVNTSKIFRSDDGRPLEGIGMAVSANDVRDRLDSLSRGESVLLDRPPSFGTLELATVLDDLLPRSFEELDPEAEDMSITALGLEDYFSNLVLYASAEPFQVIMAATGELSDLERISLEYELSNTDVFMNEIAKGALLELDNADPDTGIDDFGLLDLRRVGDISAGIWMDISFDGIGIRAEMIMFLRNNQAGMVWVYHFPETYPSVSLDDVARAIDDSMTD